MSIDITPLVDVVFLLLIFFLITSTFVRDKRPAIPIDAPQAKSAVQQTVQPSTVTVHVSKEGRLFLDQAEMKDLEALEAALSGIVERGADSADTTLLIRADEQARHGMVVQIMDIARKVGLGRFGIVTREE